MTHDAPPAAAFSWSRILPAGCLVIAGLALLGTSPWVGGGAIGMGLVALHLALRN